MLDDAINRLQELDRTLDGPTVTRAVAVDLAGRDRPLHDRTDALVGALRADLVDLLVQPRQLTSAGRRSVAALRRAQRCRLTFDEGYLVGRVGLDTHRLPLLWSGLSLTTPTPATRVVQSRLVTLRSLVLSPAMTDAYHAGPRLAPLVRDLTDETRGLPADQAAQFAGLGLLTAVAEWTLLVGGHNHRVELLLAGC